MKCYPDETLAPSCYKTRATRGDVQLACHGFTRYDVATVGGGHAGLSAACLAETGVSVALSELRRIGCGASGRNG